MHYQVKQLVLEAVKSDDEIDQGDFCGGFWQIVRVGELGRHEELEVGRVVEH